MDYYVVKKMQLCLMRLGRAGSAGRPYLRSGRPAVSWDTMVSQDETRKWCPRHSNILRRSPLSPDPGLLGTRVQSQDRWCPGTPPAVPGHLVSEDTLRTRLASQDSARSVLRHRCPRTSLRILGQDDRMESPESPRKTKIRRRAVTPRVNRCF